VRRVEGNCSTGPSDGTICPVSGSALQVRHRKNGHGVRVRVVSIDEPKRKSLHEVASSAASGWMMSSGCWLTCRA
jgi:hypothetical protein